MAVSFGRENVGVVLHFSDCEEVACDVEHRSAPGEPGLIHDSKRGYWPDAAGDTNLRFDVGGQKLPDRLYATKESSWSAGDEAHRIGRHN